MMESLAGGQLYGSLHLSLLEVLMVPYVIKSVFKDHHPMRFN